MKSKLLEYKADLMLLSVAIFWGITFLMVKDAIKSVPVYSFLFFRFTLSTILMYFIARKFFNKLNKQNVTYGVILGFFLFSAFATQTFGLSYTKSSIVAFITGLNVIIVPFFAYFLFKEKIKKQVIFASFIAVFGLYLLTLSGKLTFDIGEFLTLICAFLFALQILYTGIFSKKENVFMIVFFQFLTVSILSLIFSLFLDEKTFDITYDFVFFKALIITAIFATVYAFLVQTYMQQFTTSTKTAIIFTMEPVSAGIYAYFTIGEILNSIQLIGASLIIVATLLAEIRLKKRKLF